MKNVRMPSRDPDRKCMQRSRTRRFVIVVTKPRGIRVCFVTMHTNQETGTFFWYPENSQGAWQNQFGIGTINTQRLANQQHPVKPRPPPRCYLNVGRQSRAKSDILPPRYRPNEDFGRRVDVAPTFGNTFPSKARVHIQFEVPGPGMYRPEKAHPLTQKSSPQVSMGTSQRPNYFKEVIKKAQELPDQKMVVMKDPKWGPSVVHYYSEFPSLKEPVHEPGPGHYLSGVARARTDAIIPASMRSSGQSFSRAPRFSRRDRTRTETAEEKECRRARCDYVNENSQHVRTDSDKRSTIEAATIKRKERALQAQLNRELKAKKHNERQKELAKNYMASQNRRKISFWMRCVSYATRTVHFANNLERVRRENLEKNIRKAEQYRTNRVFRRWCAMFEAERRKKKGMMIMSFITRTVIRRRIEKKKKGANIIRRILHSEQGMDTALKKIRIFRHNTRKVQSFLKKCKLATESRVELIFRQVFRLVVKMTIVLEAKENSEVHAAMETASSNENKHLDSDAHMKARKRHGKGHPPGKLKGTKHHKGGGKRHTIKNGKSEAQKPPPAGSSNDPIKAMALRQQRLDALKPTLYELAEIYQARGWEKFKVKFKKRYAAYQALQNDLREELYDRTRDELKQRILHFEWPRYSWLASEATMVELGHLAMNELKEVFELVKE